MEIIPLNVVFLLTITNLVRKFVKKHQIKDGSLVNTGCRNWTELLSDKETAGPQEVKEICHNQSLIKTRTLALQKSQWKPNQ
jgi:hypothetical protein